MKTDQKTTQKNSTECETLAKVKENNVFKSTCYHVKIRGHLGPQWSEWFGNVDMELDKEGNTLLSGPFVDQAAVHALLRKVRDAGMILHSVTCVENESKER